MKYFTLPQLSDELHIDLARTIELINDFNFPLLEMNQRIRVRLSKKDIDLIGSYLTSQKYN